MAVLKQVTGDLAGTLIDLKSDVTVIGRLPECDIILAPNGVSRRHAEIRKVGPAFFLVDLDSRNKTLRQRHRVEGWCRASSEGERPDQHLRRRVRLLTPSSRPRRRIQNPPPTSWRSPRATARKIRTSVTLEASRSSTMASTVRPEVKLKAILEITRSLSNELRIDAVAPKILDSLMEIFPGAERLFLMLQDPVEQATGA